MRHRISSDPDEDEPVIGPLPIDVLALLDRVGSLVSNARDIVERRVDDGKIPAWCDARGWTGFLLSLSSEDLSRSEGQGLASCVDLLAGAPQSLRELAGQVRAIQLAVPVSEPSASCPRVARASPRKASQLAGLLQAAAPLIERSQRVVDVGSGRGSLAMSLASKFDRPVVGVELVEDRVRGAAKRAVDREIRFEHRDALVRELGLQPGDLAMGLHACGELGDELVREAIAARVDVALVTCCVQKVQGAHRTPLSAAARARGLTLPRDVLGLANLTSRRQGVEVPIEQTMRAREARCALRLVLRERGTAIRAGDEMRGLNRRQAMRGARALIDTALAARGMPGAMPAEIEQAQLRAAEVFGQVRRLTLPRAMLGPVVELAVVLDRACALVEAGYQVQVSRLFAPEASPRNLLILGQVQMG